MVGSTSDTGIKMTRRGPAEGCSTAIFESWKHVPSCARYRGQEILCLVPHLNWIWFMCCHDWMGSQQSCHCHAAQLREEQKKYFYILVKLNDLPVRSGVLSQNSVSDGSHDQSCTHLLASPNTFGRRGGLYENHTSFDADTATHHGKTHE